MSILVTGAAGFIGFHLCKKLIEVKYEVIGLDNLNNYYDVNLKKNRIQELERIALQKELILNLLKAIYQTKMN